MWAGIRSSVRRRRQVGVYFARVTDTKKGSPMKSEDVVPQSRKEYFPPKIVHTEKIETRAVACTMADNSCAAGPIQS